MANLLLSFLLAVLMMSAASGQEPPEHGKWQTIEHPTATELIVSSTGGSFGVICNDSGCNFFLEPNSGCVPFVRYPILINSVRRMGVLNTKCVLLQSDSSPRLVLLLSDKQPLINAMLSEMDISIAFPEQAGGMTVIDAPMTGTRELLSGVMPDLPKAPAKVDAVI